MNFYPATNRPVFEPALRKQIAGHPSAIFPRPEMAGEWGSFFPPLAAITRLGTSRRFRRAWLARARPGTLSSFALRTAAPGVSPNQAQSQSHE